MILVWSVLCCLLVGIAFANEQVHLKDIKSKSLQGEESLGEKAIVLQTTSPPVTLELKSTNGMSYTIDITIGSSPAVETNFKVDTGIFNTWLPGTGCTYVNLLQDCRSIHTTPPDTDKLDSFTQQYSKSIVVKGAYYKKNTVKIDTVTIKEIDIGFATSLPEKHASWKYDGALGLSLFHKDGNQTTHTPFIKTMLSEFTKQKFTTFIPPLVGGNPTSGSLVLGDGFPKTDCKEESVYTSTIPAEEKQWKVTVKGAAYNNAPLKDSGGSAILNSGVYYIGVPSCPFKQLYKKYNLNGTVECGKSPGGSLKFTIGDNSLSIPLKNLEYKVETTCKYAIKQSQTNDWVFGLPFYQSYCITHDIESNEISFHEHK